MKYAQISQLRQEGSVSRLCHTLGVSESGYHAWRTRDSSHRSQEETRLKAAIRPGSPMAQNGCKPYWRTRASQSASTASSVSVEKRGCVADRNGDSRPPRIPATRCPLPPMC